MKAIFKIQLAVMAIFITSFSFAQKVQTFTVERTINASAERVWKVVGEEFADIAKSHPKLSGSHSVDGSPLTGEGCERVCSLNSDGSKYTHEKMVEYNPEAFSFKAEIYGAGGLPIDTTASYMIYDVDPIDETTCKITLTMVYRTSPAFMGSLAKGKFRKNIEDYAIAIEHYTLTGEDVNPDNFKQIKKKYS